MPKRSHIVAPNLTDPKPGVSDDGVLMVAAARAEALLADLARELGRRAARQHFTEAQQQQLQAHGQPVEQPHAVG